MTLCGLCWPPELAAIPGPPGVCCTMPGIVTTADC